MDIQHKCVSQPTHAQFHQIVHLLQLPPLSLCYPLWPCLSITTCSTLYVSICTSMLCGDPIPTFNHLLSPIILGLCTQEDVRLHPIWTIDYYCLVLLSCRPSNLPVHICRV